MTANAESNDRDRRAELDDWNRRVRRLAQSYAPKYRPVLLPISYRTNLDSGRAWPRVETIAQESARYRDGKPLSTRQVKRLLAEMENAGAIKSEPRFSEHTGRQRSSYRYLVTSVAVNRYGYSIPHDFYAPFPQVNEGCHEAVTGQLQPYVTLHDTPRDTPRTSSGLSLDCPRTEEGPPAPSLPTPSPPPSEEAVRLMKELEHARQMAAASESGPQRKDWPRVVRQLEAKLAGASGN